VAETRVVVLRETLVGDKEGCSLLLLLLLVMLFSAVLWRHVRTLLGFSFFFFSFSSFGFFMGEEEEEGDDDDDDEEELDLEVADDGTIIGILRSGRIVRRETGSVFFSFINMADRPSFVLVIIVVESTTT
jgi:hypothetical protein